MVPSRKWSIVVALFINEILLMGGVVNTFGVFFDPLMRQFHWSHAQVSLLASLIFALGAVMGPLAGWLFERIQARILMLMGIVACAVAFISASQANSYGVMLAAFILAGIGLSLCTVLAIAVVVGNSFDESERGRAMGIGMSGNGAGGFFMLPVASFAVAWFGWRGAYLLLAAPMILISIPLILIFIHSGPGKKVASHSNLSFAGSEDGLDVSEACRTRAFWIILTVIFLYAFSLSVPLVHLIPYLIQVGYSPNRAAGSMSIVQGITCLGTIFWGALVDRFGARPIMMCVPLIGAASLLLLLGAGQLGILLVFILMFGLILNSITAVMPLLFAESLGMKRYAFYSGLGMATLQAAIAIGPFMAGWIVDVTGTYSSALVIGAAAALCASVLTSLIPAAHYRVARVPLHA
jgi:MFS transporter, OFA family, oxalate/formate antiporter